MKDATDVTLSYGNVQAYLDCDQAKHQPVGYVIGWRDTGGGNKFNPENATEDWHREHTLPYMADWAANLEEFPDGHKEYHGQAKNINGIHYEGYCLFVKNKRYVLFHCYPDTDGKKLKLRGIQYGVTEPQTHEEPEQFIVPETRSYEHFQNNKKKNTGNRNNRNRNNTNNN